jgi:hypothetical protein
MEGSRVGATVGAVLIELTVATSIGKRFAAGHLNIGIIVLAIPVIV